MPPEDKKLNKLKQLFAMISEDYATPQDVVNMGKALMEYLDKAKADISKTIEREVVEKMATELGDSKATLNTTAQDTLAYVNGVQERVKNLVDTLLASHEVKMGELVNTVTTRIDENTSATAKAVKDEVRRIEGKIPKKTDLSGIRAEIADIEGKLPNITTEITKNGEAVRDSLELLQNDGRLDKNAIKGLEEYDELVKLAKTPKEQTIAGVRLLRYLADVNIEGITNGQTIIWNSTLSRFEAGTGSGYTDLTEFVDQTPWRVFYSGAAGDVTELALGADGTFLKSNGASSAPSFSTPAGSGDVSKVGTPVNNQVGVWTGDGTLEGDASLTFDTTTNTLATEIVTVTDDAYAAGWNGSTAVPTKNAIYDKIESLSGGGITRSVVVTSGSATMGSTASTDYVYLVAGAHTMSLPAASGNTNLYTVKNNHSANITIDTAGAETIDGAASISIAPEEAVGIISNGTNFNIL